jgi:hypothetical protein
MSKLLLRGSDIFRVSFIRRSFRAEVAELEVVEVDAGSNAGLVEPVPERIVSQRMPLFVHGQFRRDDLAFNRTLSSDDALQLMQKFTQYPNPHFLFGLVLPYLNEASSQMRFVDLE